MGVPLPLFLALVAGLTGTDPVQVYIPGWVWPIGATLLSVWALKASEAWWHR